MSSVIRLDFSVGPFFFLTAHATLGEDTILTRAATITTQVGASRVASIHTRRSAPVHVHVMVRALSDAPLLLHMRVGAVKNPTAPTQVYASSTDVASAETKTALRIILHVDTIDIRPPMVLFN